MDPTLALGIILGAALVALASLTRNRSQGCGAVATLLLAAFLFAAATIAGAYADLPSLRGGP